MNKGIEVYPTYILKRLDYLGLKGILVMEKEKYLVLELLATHSIHSYSVIESCSNSKLMFYHLCRLEISSKAIALNFQQ